MGHWAAIGNTAENKTDGSKSLQLHILIALTSDVPLPIRMGQHRKIE